MSEVYCNDPTCKEHYCQISGRKLDIKNNIYPENVKIGLGAWIEQLEKKIEELEKQFALFKIEEAKNEKWLKRFNESIKKEEEYNLTFKEALEAMIEGHKVRSKRWTNGYIFLNETQRHFFNDENILIKLEAFHMLEDKWRIVRE